jgi:hypothetical protein
VTRCKPCQKAPVRARLGLAEHAQTGSGERIIEADRAVEQQGNPRVGGDVAAVLSEIGEKEERAGIEIDGDEDERGIGRAAPAPRDLPRRRPGSRGDPRSAIICANGASGAA